MFLGILMRAIEVHFKRLEIGWFFRLSQEYFCWDTCPARKLSLIKAMLSVRAYHAEQKFTLNRINDVYLFLSALWTSLFFKKKFEDTIFNRNSF